MLTSTEEVYTDYLENRVVANGVDATIVHATLVQMGFDQMTIAAMMGETNVLSSPFSTTSSAPSTFTSISSVRKPSFESGFFAASNPSDPLEIEGAQQLQSIISIPDHSASDTPTVAPATATVSASVSPSIVSVVVHNSGNACDAYVPPPTTVGVASPPPPSVSSSAAVSMSAPLRTAIGADNRSGIDVCTRAAVYYPSRAESSESAVDIKDIEVACASSRSSPSPSKAVAASAAEKVKVTAADQDILVWWMREYKALMLSSSLPRPTSRSDIDVQPSSTAVALTQEARSHEFCHTPPEVPAMDRTDDDSTYGEVSIISAERTAAKLPSHRSNATAHACRQSDGTDTSALSSDGATSSNSSTFIRTKAVHHPLSVFLAQGGVEAAAKTQGEGACIFAECHYRSGSRPHRSVHPAPTVPNRRYAVKGKSSTLVPACGVRTPRGATGCLRCNFDVSQCRRPYREAQDVRIVRASHVAVMGNGGYDHCAIPSSCSQARDLDGARRAQQTSRAKPMCGRRVPVMHAPIGKSVQPRAGLANGRQTSTLPDKAKTDRVQLARYYLCHWEQQERRSGAAARSAAWDARYALLGCAGCNG